MNGHVLNPDHRIMLHIHAQPMSLPKVSVTTPRSYKGHTMMTLLYKFDMLR